MLKLAETIGKKLNVVCNGTFFQWLAMQGFMLPGPNVRWCTRILKQTPQDRFYEASGVEVVHMGIRGDEPRRLETIRKPRYGKHVFEYPLADAGYGKKEVKEICRKYDLLNPVYEWRTNVSCFCCFFQRKSDWRGLLLNCPSLFALSEQWEKQAWVMGKRQGLENPYGWNDSFTLEQFRKAKEEQYQLWPDPEGEPCLICSI